MNLGRLNHIFRVVWIGLTLSIVGVCLGSNDALADIRHKITRSVSTWREYESNWNSYRRRLKESFTELPPDISDRYPTIRQAILEGARRLLQAQIDVIESDPRNPRIASAEFVIRVVDEPSPNAQIYILKDVRTRGGLFVSSKYYPGVDGLQKVSQKSKYARIFNVVDISSGLIDRLANSPEEFDRILGVIAHEFAHMSDYISLTQTFMKVDASDEMLSQSREYAADYFGREILKKAKFRPAVLYEGLEALDNAAKNQKQTDVKVIEGLVSTHPEDHLRQAANRAHLTLDRYEKGWPTPIPLITRIDPKELKSVRSVHYFDRSEARRFTTVVEGVEFLLAISNAWKGSEAYRNIDNQRTFNLAWTRLDQILAGSIQTALDAQTIQKFAELQALFAMEKQASPQSRKFPPIFDELEVDGERLPVSARRRMVLERHPLFQSVEYRNAFIQAWQQLLKPSIDSVQEAIYSRISQLRFVLAPGSVSLSFFDVPIFEQSFAHSINLDKIHAQALEKLNERDRIYFLRRILEHPRVKESGISEIYSFVKSATPESFSPLLKFEGRNPIQLAPRLEEERRLLLREFWKNKSKFAVCELFLRDNRLFDWPSIFRAVGVSYEEGVRQLQGELKVIFSSQKGEDWAYFFRKPPLENKDTGYTHLLLERSQNLSRPQNPIWLDSEILPYLKGEMLPSYQRIDRSALTQTLGVRVYTAKPNDFRRDFKQRFEYYTRNLNESNVSGDALRKLIYRSFQELMDDPDAGFNHTAPYSREWANQNLYQLLPSIEDQIVQWIDFSTLSAAKKTELLKDLFRSDGNTVVGQGNGWRLPERWHADLFRNEKAVQLYRKLRSYGVLGSTWRFTIPRNPAKRRAFLKYPDRIAVIRLHLEEIIANAAIAPLDAREQLSHFVDDLWNFSDLTIVRTEAWEQVKRRVVDALELLEIPIESRVKILSLITYDGSLPEVDRALLKLTRHPGFKVEHFSDFATKARYRETKGRFHRPKMQVQWLERFLEFRTEGHEVAPSDVKSIASEIAALASEATAARDEVLEALAWKSPLARVADLDYLEGLKSYSSSASATPERVRISSAVSSYVQSLSSTEIKGLIHHLRDHAGEPLSVELRGKLRESLMGNVALRRRLVDQLSQVYTWWKEADQASPSDFADTTLDWLDGMLANMRGSERIPIIDLLIHSGSKPLNAADGWEIQFAREFLGYKKGSDNEKILRAFILASPEHERSVAMAYLCSLDPKTIQKDSLKPIFQVFKTPGKKAAQAVDTWKLLGDRSVDFRDFKSSNELAMTKFRYLSILEGELGSQFNGVRIEEVLGSASMKTVAEGTTPDGESLAFSVIDPYAKDQSTSHLEFAKAFLKNLENEGLAGEAHLMASLISSLERQIIIETDTSHEVSSMKRAKSALERITAKNGGNIEGWSVIVPEVSKKFGHTAHVIVMSVAQGKFFEHLAPAEQVSGGKAFLSAVIQLLFEEGIWDADRHRRNQFFKVNSKQIVIIDWGQAESFSMSRVWLPDDRTRIAELLYSFSLRDGVYTATVITKMSKDGGRIPTDRVRELGNEISALYAKGLSADGEAIELFKLSQRLGFDIEDRFGVGFLKGLLTLGGEEYADPEVLRDMLSDAVAKHLRKKGLFGLISRYESVRIKNPKLNRYQCMRLIMKELP